MPMATWRATISATACFTCVSNSARSYSSSRSFLFSIATNGCRRGRLPTCVVRIRSVLRFMIRSSVPQLLRCQLATFDQRPERAIRDLGIDPACVADKGSKATIGASDDTLAADKVGELADTLGHQFQVLDLVGTGIDHARDQHF